MQAKSTEYAEVEKVFYTPFIKYVWSNSADLNCSLRKIILEKEKVIKSVNQSNRGGWHSKTDFLKWDNQSVGILKERIQKIVSYAMENAIVPLEKNYLINWRIFAWANISRHGNFNVIHNHGNNVWAGVYYVDLGKNDLAKDGSGILELHDPRTLWKAPKAPKELLVGSPYYITPEPGMMVLFPGYINHLVKPYLGDGERISIAFNVQIESIDCCE